MRPGDVSDVTHRKRGPRFEKSQKKKVDFQARRGLAAGATCGRVGWERWKSHHRKIVLLSSLC